MITKIDFSIFLPIIEIRFFFKRIRFCKKENPNRILPRAINTDEKLLVNDFNVLILFLKYLN